MLLKPSPDDWLMYSRTYDAQRFSPLKQINRQNVGQLKEVFKKELGNGPHESIPIVYRGVMYLLLPGAVIQAIDASTGALIWEHQRPSGASRAKTIAIYDDMVYYTSPDGFIVALDARTGEVRWETKIDRRHGGRRHRRRGQGDLRALLRADRATTATSRRTTRRPARSCGGSTRRRPRTSPAATRWAGAPDATRVGVHVGAARRLRPGEAARSIGASPTRRRTPAPTATAARYDAVPASRRRSTSTATRPSR